MAETEYVVTPRGPESVRLVVFRPPSWDDMAEAQYTELSYRNGYPIMVGQRVIPFYLPQVWTDPANRVEALWSAADALRSR